MLWTMDVVAVDKTFNNFVIATLTVPNEPRSISI